MRVEPTFGLIVDVGMHTGEDTEFYLSKGFSVVAIEAVPAFAQAAEERFAEALESKRLTIINAAIADYEGEIEFFLSQEGLWGSTDPQMADRGFGNSLSRIVVPCTTLDVILRDLPRPHYVKIDIEGRDKDCIDALHRVDELPIFVSFEADLSNPEGTAALVEELSALGYQDFKLVNQATHAFTKLPNPPLEGNYVNAQFTKHMSGPFGREIPGEWVGRDELAKRFQETVHRQRARIEYSANGTIAGVPLSWARKPLMRLYNAPMVTRARLFYAHRRGIESGGWFDIHARLGSHSRARG